MVGLAAIAEMAERAKEMALVNAKWAWTHTVYVSPPDATTTTPRTWITHDGISHP